MAFGQFTGEFNFIRATRNEGISQKNGKPFDFATLVVADQYESFDLEIQPTLVPHLININKGDKVSLDITVGKNFGKTTYLVTNVKSLALAK